jgi:hypothetical protein
MIVAILYIIYQSCRRGFLVGWAAGTVLSMVDESHQFWARTGEGQEK